MVRPLVSDLAWQMLAASPDRIASYSERTATYSALALLDRRHDFRSFTLAASELKVFSQNGEDGVIAELMSRLGVKQGHFIEFGTEDGREGNCVLLADVLNWSGLFVEGDARSFERLSSRFAFNDRVETRCAFVTPQNINELFRDQPEDTDILSIDIDGQDYWVWEALTVVRPKVIVIEYNSGKGPLDSTVEPLGSSPAYTQEFGASIGALQKLASSKGYSLVYLELCGINAFFVRDDFSELFPDTITYRSPNYFLSGLTHSGAGPEMVPIDSAGPESP